MTFNFAPWAIDGARTPASLARLAAYASGGRRSGVVQPSDLRVSALAVPGQGLRISSGAAVVLNRYLTDPDEAYIVSNPSEHNVLAADMPSATPGTSYYLVCVVVGDAEFDQSEHPYMPSNALDPQVALTFEYVRIVVVPCTAGTTSFEQLGYNYPAYALARLEVPGNTTTITNAMITDLRSLTSERQGGDLLLAQPVSDPNGYSLAVADYTSINGYAPTIQIPSWATHAQVVGTISGINHIDPLLVGGQVIKIANLVGAETFHELQDTSGAGERVHLMAIWKGEVAALAGTSVPITMQVKRISGTGGLHAYPDTTVILDVRFYERPV